MTGADHFWEKRDGWDVCARCGVVKNFNLGAQCRGALGSAPRDGEQSPTSDERETDRLRNEVSALTALADAREAEVARLRRLVTAAAAVLDGLLTNVAASGLPVHPLAVFHLRRLAHDLLAVLDQGAPR